MNELINKYIPKRYHDVVLNSTYGGMSSTANIVRSGGVNRPEDELVITPLKVDHQSYSSHAYIHQVTLPSNDRILTNFSHSKTLGGIALAHISATTGEVTLLRDIHGSVFHNKSLTQLFGAKVNTNKTQFPFAPDRIGGYAAEPGLQFTHTKGNELVSTNAKKDFRIKTSRKISGQVRKELKAGTELLYTKAKLIQQTIGIPRLYQVNNKIPLFAEEMGASIALVEFLDDAYFSTAFYNTPYKLIALPPMGEWSDGQELTLKPQGFADVLFGAVNGSTSHQLLSLVLATTPGHNNIDPLSLAPIFIAARGGYSLKEIK